MTIFSFIFYCEFMVSLGEKKPKSTQEIAYKCVDQTI